MGKKPKKKLVNRGLIGKVKKKATKVKAKVIARIAKKKVAVKKKPTTTKVVKRVAPATAINKVDLASEAWRLRVHLTYLRKDLGTVQTETTPEWAPNGLARVTAALVAVNGISELASDGEISYEATEVNTSHKLAKQTSGALVKIISGLLERIAKSRSADTDDDAWFEAAEQALDKACLSLERFDEPIEPINDGGSAEPEAILTPGGVAPGEIEAVADAESLTGGKILCDYNEDAMPLVEGKVEE